MTVSRSLLVDTVASSTSCSSKCDRLVSVSCVLVQTSKLKETVAVRHSYQPNIIIQACLSRIELMLSLPRKAIVISTSASPYVRKYSPYSSVQMTNFNTYTLFGHQRYQKKIEGFLLIYLCTSFHFLYVLFPHISKRIINQNRIEIERKKKSTFGGFFVPCNYSHAWLRVTLCDSGLCCCVPYCL